MSSHLPNQRWPIFAALAALAAMAGCGRQEEIRHYRVLKPEVVAEVNRNEVSARKAKPSAAPAAKDLLLGAIVEHGPKLWFFKLVGPKDLVAQHAEEFVAFIKSVHFGQSADANPEWTKPETWQQRPGSQMRYATLVVGSDEPALELTVIGLPSGSDNFEQDLLANINRWRDQLQLPPIVKSELPKNTSQLTLAGDKTAILVNLLGKLKAAAMSPAPFLEGNR